MLRLEGITLQQGGFRLSASFQLDPGRNLALIGPSGAGKSTLLNLIAGFLKPDAGRLLWQGEDITNRGPGERPISILFQDNNLFPHLTAAQNVGLGLHPNLRLSANERQQVSAALSRVGLGDKADRKPASLSGGQQSRIALARILVQKRDLVLLDEPFAALGPALKTDMLGLLAELLQETGASLIMVSHDPTDAMQIADQTCVVADGAVSSPGSTKAVFSDPPPVLAAYLGHKARARE